MVTCLSCGIENSSTRVFCAVCGTRLREDDPLPVEVPEVITPPEPSAPKSVLPSWLQGADLELAPPPVDPVVPSFTYPAETRRPTTPKAAVPGDWDEKLDFSDLPDWDMDDPSVDTSAPDPDPAPFDVPIVEDEPFYAEGEGNGLLTGVRGPIPIEPIVSITHRPPEFPAITEEVPTDATQEAANLFAQIAGGAVRPDPITVARPTLPGAGLLYLLLLLVVTIPLALELIVFDLPAPRSSVVAYAGVIDALPADGTVLVAVDYDGGVQDELTPALAATLSHLRRTLSAGTITAVTTSPFGSAVAEAAWRSSQPTQGATWNNQGFTSGGVSGQRTLLSVTSADVVIVVAADSGKAGSWIEQNSALAPTRPVLALVPATAETMVSPYLASGQVAGALMSINDTATYEATTLGMRRRDSLGWRRLDAATLAATAMVGVILLGTVVGLFSKRR